MRLKGYFKVSLRLTNTFLVWVTQVQLASPMTFGCDCPSLCCCKKIGYLLVTTLVFLAISFLKDRHELGGRPDLGIKTPTITCNVPGPSRVGDLRLLFRSSSLWKEVSARTRSQTQPSLTNSD